MMEKFSSFPTTNKMNKVRKEKLPKYKVVLTQLLEDRSLSHNVNFLFPVHPSHQNSLAVEIPSKLKN